MQVLTGQYPTLYTHKFRLFYSDFQPSALKYGNINFLTFAKGYQILAITAYLNTAFSGAAHTNLFCNFYYSDNVGTDVSTTGNLLVASLFGAADQSKGILKTIQGATNRTGSPATVKSANLLSPTTLTAQLVLSGTGNINQFSAGAFDVWVTLIRQS